jgi:chemotaxis protein MotC
MRTLATSLLMLWALAPVASRAADESAKQPFELVRELQIFQDQAVLKTKNARAEQKERVAKVAAQLIEFDNKVWADPRNARAAVIYVLGGGDPRVLRKLTGVGGETSIDERLINGALAYGERRDAEATKLLEGIDVDSLDRSIGGHVALVSALLVVDSDPRKAFSLLDRARLAAPGTIVEEAALRRQAILAAKLDDLDAFEALSSQYFRRFAGSIFVSSFERQFARAVVSHDYGTDAKRLAKLQTLLRGLSEVERRETCLALAEEGIAVASVEVVRLAARMASVNAKAQPLDTMRLLLFEAAALVATPDSEQGRLALWLVDKSKLDAREEALLHAALSVADAIARPPSFGAAPSAPEKAAGEPGDSATSGVIRDAQSAIARVDGLLSETSR